MIPRRLFLLTIAATAVGAAIKLIPGDLERVAMFERDGRFAEAQSELQRQYDSGRREPAALIELYKLNVRFGDVAAAQKYLEEYSRTKPQDLQAQTALLKFYKLNSKNDEYLALLKSLNARFHNKEILSELLGYYRMAGESVAEEDELETAARTNRPSLSPSDLERLGLLAAARGDLPRAAKALRQADARRDPQARHGRQSLFQILVDLNVTDEAESRALGWLRRWRDPELLVDFMSSLSRAGRWDLGVKLADDSGITDDRATLAVAELLTQGQRFEEARLRLAGFKPQALPNDTETLLQLTSVAATAGDAPLALRAARQTGIHHLNTDTVVELLSCLEEHNANFGLRGLPHKLLKGLAADIEHQLPPAPAPYSAHRLFAASLAIHDGNSQLASRFLSTVNSDQLSRRQRNELASLRVRAGYSLGTESRLAHEFPTTTSRSSKFATETAMRHVGINARSHSTVTASLDRDVGKQSKGSAVRKEREPLSRKEKEMAAFKDKRKESKAPLGMKTATQTAAVVKPSSVSRKAKPVKHRLPTRHPQSTTA